MNNQSYTERKSGNPIRLKFDLTKTRDVFFTIYSDLTNAGCFQEHLGFHCSKGQFHSRKIGSEEMVSLTIYTELKKNNLYPIEKYFLNYSEDDIFDVIELLFRYVSKPTISGSSHDGCVHYREFDKKEGENDLRLKFNNILLKHCEQGYELSEEGQIIHSIDEGFEELFEQSTLSGEPEKIEARIESAIKRFRSRNVTPDDKRHAVKDLADVFEQLRPQLKIAISKNDENDLFNIANKFGIRHWNNAQKIDYESDIWLDWMFYHFLATARMALKRLQNP